MTLKWPMMTETITRPHNSDNTCAIVWDSSRNDRLVRKERTTDRQTGNIDTLGIHGASLVRGAPNGLVKMCLINSAAFFAVH